MNKAVVAAVTFAIALGTAAAFLWPHDPLRTSQPEVDTIVPATPAITQTAAPDLPNLAVAPSPPPSDSPASVRTHASRRKPSSSPPGKGPMVDVR